MEPLQQISQIQEMLPTREQAFALVDYHADWILFLHCSFHPPAFKRELNQFYKDTNGYISMTSTGLQWASLLFAIICGTMTCAKPAQVARLGFHQGMLRRCVSSFKHEANKSTDDQATLAKQWFNASTECLNIARYQQNHNS